MSPASQKFVLDANAFIQAKQKFYPLDFCPGYWQALIWHHRQGTVCSVDKVLDELRQGGDDLWAWAETELGPAAFANTAEPAVAAVYAQLLAWVMAQPQFQGAAKAEFQAVADGWLAAYAKANRCVVVTLEEFNPDKKNRVPLPNVCRAFDVEVVTPFEMLRRLNVRLSWQPPP